MRTLGKWLFYELLSSRYFIQVFHSHKHVRQVLPSQCGTSGDLEYYYPMLMNGLGFRAVPLQFIAPYLNRSGKVRHYDGSMSCLRLQNSNSVMARTRWNFPMWCALLLMCSALTTNPHLALSYNMHRRNRRTVLKFKWRKNCWNAF